IVNSFRSLFFRKPRLLFNLTCISIVINSSKMYTNMLSRMLQLQVYANIVGDPKNYRIQPSKIFPSVKFTVAKKADSLYVVVSGSSIVAKVNFKFTHHLISSFFSLSIELLRNSLSLKMTTVEIMGEDDHSEDDYNGDAYFRSLIFLYNDLSCFVMHIRNRIS
ncbi:ribonuclease H2 subunit A, partial [Tanacetum coccineum]